MISPTLSSELQSYAIGEKLLGLRKGRKMRLVELAAHTGLSVAMLSKIERGKLIPTLPTLLRIAMVFSVGLEYFFVDENRRHAFAIVRRKARRRFPARPDDPGSNYNFETLDFMAVERKLNGYFAEFNAVEADQLSTHQHQGAEFLYVMTGSLGVTRMGQEHVLDAGDSLYFDSNVPHAYRRVSTDPCTAIVVTVP